MPPKTGNASGDTRRRVDEKISPPVKNTLCQCAQIEQAPHVEADVDDSDVHVVRSQYPPGLRRKRKGAPVGSPFQQLGTCRRYEGRSGQSHQHENSYVDSDQNSREGNRGRSLLGRTD